MKPEGNGKIAEGETVELPGISTREDRLKAQRVWPPLKDNEGEKETLNKIRNFIRLKNEESRYLGLQEKYKEVEDAK